MSSAGNGLGRILRQRRQMVPFTLRELATVSRISPSHLGRVERGDRFPSATILRKVAGPLGFAESELLCLAGYLSRHSSDSEPEYGSYSTERLDPYVAKMLSQEPSDIQRTVIGILSILKSVARGTIVNSAL